MDEKRTIFERIPVFALSIAALLIAATSGIWIASTQSKVPAKQVKAVQRHDDEESFVSTSDSSKAKKASKPKSNKASKQKTKKPKGSYGKTKNSKPSKGTKPSKESKNSKP